MAKGAPSLGSRLLNPLKDFGTGAGQALMETGELLGDLATDPKGTLGGIKDGAIAAINDPSLLLQLCSDRGNVAKCIGEQAPAVLGGAGIAKLGTLGKLSPKSPDAGHGGPAGRGEGDGPARIYSARELRRRAAEPGPFHNFPESFNREIYSRGSRTVRRDFFNKPRHGLSNDSVQYRLRGAVNGRAGTFEIFVRPSLSGRSEVVQHRFFKPDGS